MTLMTLEQAIASYEKSAERYHKAFLRNKAHGGEFYQREAESDRICEEHERQLAAWLRELQERRKAPEIVRCGECRHRDPEDKKCDCGHDIIWQLPRGDDWYCADAERRTDG